MQFRTLRLSGFKSFVESTELEIPHGLTGIVGPNGCGKSNIVEALRWVMGETSAKRMRGGEMDDVIFGGSGGRPARNIAEVVLTLTNDGGPIPAIFEKFEEIEVRRRIERGAGSDYRVNGRPVRARDVQLLFADAAIGASSPAMVSQGRISALIAAKPSERRFILEDAAGIAGLQSRRHEAELKLKAAENNLEQLGRVLETLRGQEAGLKRQARQAEKYRQAAERMREIEALLLHCAWIEAIARQQQAGDALGVAEAAVRDAMIAVASTAARESAGESDIVSLRQAEHEAQQTVRSLTQRQHALESERSQIEAGRAEATREIAQANTDLEHETRERAEADAAITRLKQETAEIAQRKPQAAQALEQASAAEAAQRAVVATAEEASLAARAVIAEAEAREAALLRQIRDAEARRQQAASVFERARQEVANLARTETDDIEALENQAAEARALLETAQAAIEPAARQRAESETALTQSRNDASTARDAESRLKAEIAGVEAGLAGSTPQAGTNPVTAQIGAKPGYEAALAVALGEESKASLKADAAHRWVELPAIGEPPKGTEPLSDAVTIPAALGRAMAGVGVAPRDQAMALQANLLPGQSIVTREGALFRWDGLVREAGLKATDPIAAALAQRNRLVDLRARLAEAVEAAAKAQAVLAEHQGRFASAQAQERAALDAAGAALRESQRRESALAEARTRAEAALRRDRQLREALAVAEREAQTTGETCEVLYKERDELPDLAAARTAQHLSAQALGEARDLFARAGQAVVDARRESDRLAARLEAAANESSSWQNRIETRAQRVAELERRIEQAQARLETAGDRPDHIARDLAVVIESLGHAEQANRVRSDALIRAEMDLAERRRLARDAEKKLAATREERVRAEAGTGAANEAVEEVQARIAEKLNVSAEALAETVAFDGNQPDRAQLEGRLASLTREREAIGPVNLRAEIELQEAETEIARIESESAELSEAIVRLRQAIGKLNREARERLGAAFEVVRVHFKRLFTTLFGGGEAELALTNLEDPLEAGLEIFASPPGKTLQNLSLLSGGEQALTALALLFAMFLATPAPVCVLDEVDAPLDDANVTRFCDLLDEISSTTGTRFLIITHHRVTMARMDRLYGVTMAERGVSMLVSVDLRQAEMFAGYERAEDEIPPMERASA